MELETPRLRLRPLTGPELTLLAGDTPALEAALSIRYAGEPLEGEFLRIVAGQVQPATADAENYFWHTFWLMLRREDDTAIGSLCFKGPPADGAVEIGYGVAPAFEARGYTTEAAGALCRWALAQPGVARVVAETEKGSGASERVLQKLGMRRTETNRENSWWVLEAHTEV